MADNPFTQYGGINESGAMNEYRAMRMMSMADRMMPSLGRSHFASGRGGLGQNPLLSSMLGSDMQQPDYSQFTYDPQARAQASEYLKQYGLSPIAPQNANPNAFLPNTGFFGRHPRLAGGLEGALFGAAATKGADTWGEGISNVAGGLLEGRMARQGMVNRQFARPFQAANMLEEIQDRAQRRELQAADIEHLRAENQKLGRPDHDFRAFGVSRNDPEIATIDNTNGDIKYTPNPLYDPKSATTSELDPAKRFFDAKQREWMVDTKNNPSGVLPGSKQIGDWQREFRDKSQMEQRPQQALGAGPDGKVFEIRPGMTLPPGTTLLGQSGSVGGMTPQQKEQLKPIDDEIKKTNSKAFDDQVRRSLMTPEWLKANGIKGIAPEIKRQREQRIKQLNDQKNQILNPNPMGGGGAQVPVYDPNTGQLH